jgi:hypothetical protein
MNTASARLALPRWLAYSLRRPPLQYARSLIVRTWANRLGCDLARHCGAYRLLPRNPQRLISEALGLAAIVVELDKLTEQEASPPAGSSERRPARER